MTSAEQYAASVGEWATGAEAYGLITVDVPAEHWIEALTSARDVLGLGFFDWLSAVDELADGFSVVAHLASADGHAVRHLAVRTRVPRDKAALPTAVAVYAGAAWHERETHEMFGIDFPGHPHLAILLLPDGFEGHPLRKEFVLAARVAKAWPGAKEPGESDHGDGPTRRKIQPAGVPDPNEWGPLKGTLPPVAERPARGARAAGAAARTPRAAAAGAAAATGAAGAAAAGEGAPVRADRPRRTRSVAEGSASQAAGEAPAAPAAEGTPAAGETPAVRADRPRRTRSVSDGSVSQAAEETSAAPAAEEPKAERPAPARTRSSDAPWHNPVPAHDEKPAEASSEASSEAPAEAPAEKKDETSAGPAGPTDQDGDGA
ncbi:NADH-quinone oxidoreductase subunit C [Kitasatospora aureofaciens]|uniref:NADH-quinone oxidoreductase subunit C n=1 Tax=Kitasatospora aureofaciens TaxID=1894 RepID=UPI001C488294|nr:NADH-quinone oxidoreductase subunit C [Kitasatospora aureofaciens]MBV6696344.1 NADH-quinone oxidoreductase subunit C [Kitasatospora aureofaciens]